MAIQVETTYFLSDWSYRRDYIQLMRSMRRVNAGHVRMGPGEYVNVIKQNLLQLLFFFFGREGADISVLIWPAQEYWL